MAYVSIYDIKQELVINLRNADLISISDRGVTTSQDTGTFSAAATHTLGTNPTKVKNIRDITVATNLLVFGTDYTVNYSTGVITFTVAQTGAYVINYDQGTTDRIWPDFPQPTDNLNKFPRIAVDVISGSTSEYALGADGNFTEYIATIVCYSKEQEEVETMIASARAYLMANKKTQYYSTFITPSSMGPLIMSPFGEQKILQRNQDFRIRFVHES